MDQSIPFVGVTISHINLLFGENHQIIIVKNPPGEFLKMLISTLYLKCIIKYGFQI